MYYMKVFRKEEKKQAQKNEPAFVFILSKVLNLLAKFLKI